MTYALTNEERLTHLENTLYSLMSESLTLTIVSNVDGASNPESLREAREALGVVTRLVQESINTLSK